MTALRAALLALSGLIAAAAAGAWGAAPEPSARRLVVACAFALAAPLAWPGAGAGPVRTATRVGAWSLATAALAVLVLAGSGQPLARLAPCGAMLLAIAATTLGGAALIELLLRRRASTDDCAAPAREAAGRLAALALALAAALPLWLGPLAELASRDWPGSIDAVVAASPLTHLALASGNDLFRDTWLYEHANLATLTMSYPDLGRIGIAYACALLLLAVGIMAAHGRPDRSAIPLQPDPKEAR